MKIFLMDSGENNQCDDEKRNIFICYGHIQEEDYFLRKMEEVSVCSDFDQGLE